MTPFEVTKAVFSLKWKVQFQPFFHYIITANQIRHDFIEKISNNFFQTMFLILAALKVGQSNGWYLVVWPEVFLKTYVQIFKEISVGGS